ncbi:MarR family winged helix-turn-helix transcriptional regulator [Deinococcus sonorensis]|uniref:MarR family winged helix-turn-helix transcriptional regulator n=2 Tax=Deinococcus sonorensis TaxID=309891 RepID=A0AAU7U555_9DEIO
MPDPQTATAVHPPQDVSLFLKAMWRLNRAMAQQFEPLLHERHGTEARSYFILHSIQSGVQYPKALAEELKMPSTLISRYLDDLSKRGLIERHIDEHDSRRTLLTLTPLALQLVAEVRQTIHDVTEARLSRLSPTQLKGLTDALRILVDEGHAA